MMTAASRDARSPERRAGSTGGGSVARAGTARTSPNAARAVRAADPMKDRESGCERRTETSTDSAKDSGGARWCHGRHRHSIRRVVPPGPLVQSRFSHSPQPGRIPHLETRTKSTKKPNNKALSPTHNDPLSAPFSDRHRPTPPRQKPPRHRGRSPVAPHPEGAASRSRPEGRPGFPPRADPGSLPALTTGDAGPVPFR